MTIETSVTKAKYLGNNSAREWPLPFPVLRPEHVHLVVTDTATGRDTPISAGYSVTGCGTPNVSVTYPGSGAALPAGQRLTIYRLVPYVQQLDLENGGAFDAEVIEGQFDNTVMQIQQLSEEVSRAVKVSITSDAPAASAEDIYLQVELKAQRAESAATRAEGAAATAESAQQEGAQQLTSIKQEGAQQIARAANEADRAENAARGIPGFANNAQVFVGAKIDSGLRLTVTTSGDGDVLQLADFDAWAILPEWSRLYMLDGRLKLELPYQPLPAGV